VVAVLLLPGVLLLSYAVMRALERPLPDPRITVTILSVIAFFLAAGCEEIGWTGYALDPLQRRWGALPAALTLGAFGALWHVVPYLQGNHSGTWIIGQCVFTVASRVVIVWLYNSSGGSLLVAILFHAMSNVGSGAFPNSGSHYDPVITGAITAAVALAIILLTDRQNHTEPDAKVASLVRHDGSRAAGEPVPVLRGAGPDHVRPARQPGPQRRPIH
ncbi:CPBP family intramembrane glutamic endopeptidase, partial [Micromonospora sp. NPDC047707]|uniref:CPBP family intramembrane glutamic endopeptidase n=1 Tax=Micromonospora sp. NPDC047707 TaxID=3154498 RepID=UPI003456C040